MWGIFGLLFFALGYGMLVVVALAAILLAVTIPGAAFYLGRDLWRAIRG